MHRTTRLLAWPLALCLAAAPTLAGAGNANFFLGGRYIDTRDQDTEVIEHQGAFGASVDFQTGDLPFSWFAGLYASSRAEDDRFDDLDATVTADLVDASFGIGKIWTLGNVRPFIHGGVAAAWLNVELDIDRPGGENFVDLEDQSGAIYGEGGVTWRLGAAFNIGVAGRILWGTDYDFPKRTPDSNYVQGGLILGWGWN